VTIPVHSFLEFAITDMALMKNGLTFIDPWGKLSQVFYAILSLPVIFANMIIQRFVCTIVLLAYAALDLPNVVCPHVFIQVRSVDSFELTLATAEELTSVFPNMGIQVS
jgi:hypothetical protein